jgi:hypothetical protein
VATPPSLTNTTNISTTISVEIIVNAMTAAATITATQLFRAAQKEYKGKNGVEIPKFLRECQILRASMM